MSAVISVRVNDKEQEMLDRACKVYGCGVSSMVKRLAFEKLEEEYDMRIISEYERKKASGTLKTRPVNELLEELAL